MKNLFMKRRMLLLGAVACLTLAGCGNDNANSDGDVDNTTAETAEDSAAEGDSVASEDLFDPDLDEEIEIEDYNPADYVTLGEYKGLEVAAVNVEVTDEDVENEINSRLEEYKEEVTDRAVEDGDDVNIDYEGKHDGVAFDGGTAQGQPLSIGSNSFIEGFEEGLIGVEAGETVDLELTFPEEYSLNPDLAGQDVVFTVTVNFIEETPELTDELVKKITEEVDNVADYKKLVEEEVYQNLEEAAIASQKESVWSEVVESAVVNGYPETALQSTVQERKAYYQQNADYFGMDVDEFASMYFGVEGDDFVSYYNQEGLALLQEVMILETIAQEEGLETSEAEYKDAVAEYAELYGYESEEEFEELMGNNLSRQLLYEKVIEFLIEESVEV